MDTSILFWYTVPTIKYQASIPRYVYISRVSTFPGSVATVLYFFTHEHPPALPHLHLIFLKWRIEGDMPLAELSILLAFLALEETSTGNIDSLFFLLPLFIWFWWFIL